MYSARRDGELTGFMSMVIVDRGLHHNVKHALTDMVYVRPRYRGLTGSRLVAYVEGELRAEGVALVSLRTSKACDWRELAEHWGYVMTETVYQKWIGDA